MAGLTEEGNLIYGIEVDGVVHCGFVLRAAVLEDTYVAASLVPVRAGMGEPGKAPTPEEVLVRMAYSNAIGDATVLSQLVRLGTLEPVPSVSTLLTLIDPDDMALLQEAAQRLKKKRLPSSSSSPTLPASSAPSSVPDSA